MKTKEFVTALASKSIDVALAAKDSRLTGVDVKAADLDGDGKVAGEKELTALMTELDRFEGGKDGAVAIFDRDGELTNVGKAAAAIGDLAGVDLAKPALNDDIIFAGMRDANIAEEKAIKKAASGKVHLISSKDSIVEHRGTKYDMSDDKQIDAFSQSLGLPIAQANKIADAIKNTTFKDGRDELARMAIHWAKAERGGTMPSRMVISGHSNGDWHWGERGWLDRADVGRLAVAMPKAAGKVEDLMLSACGCGGPDVFKEWSAILPNLKTVWGYKKKSPGTGGGAEEHQARWEKVSRGRSEAMTRADAKETDPDYKTVIWTATKGMDDGSKPEKIDDVRARVTAGDPVFNDYFTGKKNVANSRQADLRAHFYDVRALAQHADVKEPEKGNMKTKRDQILLLLFWNETLMPRFAETNKALIEDGYKQAGQSKVPDFAKMNRKDTLAEIDRFLKATDTSKDPRVKELRAALIKLRDLDTANLRLI